MPAPRGSRRLKIVRYGVYDLLRSRWVVAYALFVFAIAAGLLSFGETPSQMIVGVLNLVRLAACDARAMIRWILDLDAVPAAGTRHAPAERSGWPGTRVAAPGGAAPPGCPLTGARVGIRLGKSVPGTHRRPRA